jgi:hypothetical protein
MTGAQHFFGPSTSPELLGAGCPVDYGSVWGDPSNQSETWLYPVADVYPVADNSSITGDFVTIDGRLLSNEGSSKLLLGEDPLEAARNLANDLNCLVAIVEKVCADGEPIDSFVTEVVGG